MCPCPGKQDLLTLPAILESPSSLILTKSSADLGDTCWFRGQSSSYLELLQVPCGLYSAVTWLLSFEFPKQEIGYIVRKSASALGVIYTVALLFSPGFRFVWGAGRKQLLGGWADWSCHCHQTE